MCSASLYCFFRIFTQEILSSSTFRSLDEFKYVTYWTAPYLFCSLLALVISSIKLLIFQGFCTTGDGLLTDTSDFNLSSYSSWYSFLVELSIFAHSLLFRHGFKSSALIYQCTVMHSEGASEFSWLVLVKCYLGFIPNISSQVYVFGPSPFNFSHFSNSLSWWRKTGLS